MATQGHATRLRFTPEETAAVRAELEEILKSVQFLGSKRSHDFLQFVVSRLLDGDIGSLAERFLGADLFGRPLDYDTKADSIVRVCANDVRRRLTEYYSGQRSTPRVVISLTSGSYVPEFHWPALENPSSGITDHVPESSARQLAAARGEDGADSGGRERDSPIPSSSEKLATISLDRQRRNWRRFAIIGAISSGILVLALSAACISLWYELRSAHQALYPWQSSPVVAQFWNAFLSDQRDTDLVLTDSSYSLIQDLTHKPISLADYLSRNYADRLQDRDPRMAAALKRISNWGLGSSGEFEVAQHFLALDPTHQKIHLYVSRKYMPDLMKRDNVILIGSPFGNPWAELFENRMNFTFESENPNEIANRTPSQGESRSYEYTSSGSFGYCIVAYLPNIDRNGSVLLIQGTSAEPTQAAGDFLVSEAQMGDFKKMLGVSKLPYFELLLKTSLVRGTPITTNIVAYRMYPNK